MTGRHHFPAPTPSDWLNGIVQHPEARWLGRDRWDRRTERNTQEPRYV